jgi:eukaryotic-like serine/threonine-protein kinase
MYAAMGTGRLIAGRYRLQGPIGRGAMGIVWRGRDELLARDVAVKEVQITAHASPSDAETIYQRTLREARTAARLKHPSVVTVYDVVEEGGSVWIIMELVEARSLDRIITEDGPLPPLAAAELGSSLVSALATAHAAGVMHRDVKPSNVLLTEDGKTVLTDFGIATFAEDPSMTQAGLVVGTPGFTAPERVRGDNATPASDLWSVGATLYAAVEGRGPFERIGGSTVITAGVATEDAPRAPSAGPLGPVIDALLSRDPGSRPDAATAARLLSEAATAARTGARRLGDGWLAAEASTAAARPVSGSAVSASAVSGSAAAGGAVAEGAVAEGAVAEGAVVGAADAGAAEAAGDAAAWNSAGAGAVASAAPARSSVAPGAAADVATAGTWAATEEGSGSPASAARAPAASDHAPAVPGQASQDETAQQINEQRAAFLAPPVFAELSMPEMTDPGAVDDLAGAGGGAAVGAGAIQQPVLSSDREPILWQPLKPSGGAGGGAPDAGPPSAQASSGGAGPSGGGPAVPGGPSGPGGGNGWLRFWNRSGPSKPSSGRWRLMVAGAGIAAIVVAALVGWDIYSHTQTPQALNSSPPGASGAPAGSTTHKSAGGGPAKSGGNHGSTPAAGRTGGAGAPASSGHSPSAGKPSGGSSRKPSSSASASASTSTSTSPSTSPTSSVSASASPSPSTSTSGTGPVLPTGWVWHDFSAAELGAAAGFKIGLPGAWTQNLTGEIAHFNQPARNFHLTVNVGIWTYPKPLTEAKYLNKKYAKKYNGYTELALRAVGFKAIGGFKAAPAAELKFSWVKPSAGNYTELVILASLTTKAGLQTYWFSLWAPSATFAAAHGVFHTALKTFRPLPAV